MDAAIVVASGAVLAPGTEIGLQGPGRPFVIAADGGVDAAYALGLRIDVTIGDFDSISDAGLTRAHADGAEIVRHPAAKDATDLELALDAAVARGVSSVYVLAAPAGRLDHLLANAFLLARPAYDGLTIVAQFGSARLHVIHDGTTAVLGADPGATVSLLPVRGPVASVRTEGLLYPLCDEPLTEGTTRGVSNVFEGTTAKVSVNGGTVLVVIP